MRIPNEALPSFVSDNERKANGDGQRAEPVDNSSRLRDAMSQSRAKQGKNREKGGEPASGETGDRHDKELNHRRQVQASEERRQHDRRTAKQPVLLDTRQARGRRTSAEHPKIDFKV